MEQLRHRIDALKRNVQTVQKKDEQARKEEEQLQ